MGNLKEILTNYEATPSPDGWEKLSQRLDAVMPAGEASAVAQSASTASKGILGSGAGKIVTAVVGTLLAAGAAVTILALSNSGEQTATEPSSEPIAAVDTVRSENVTPPSDDAASVEYPTVAASAEEVPVSQTSQTQSSPAAKVTTPNSQTVAAPTTVAANMTNVAPAAVSSPNTPVAITPTPVAARPSITPVALPENSVIAQSQREDPVVQSHVDESLEWSQPVKLEIPNVITPNGDGFNENFVIKGIEHCTKRQLTIRNRAGKIVYRSNAYENNWNGDNCPDGVYTYQFLFNNGSIDQTMSGTLTILRR